MRFRARGRTVQRMIVLGLVACALSLISAWPGALVLPIRAQAVETAQANLLHRGLDQYEAEQFAAAIQTWQQALEDLSGDSVQQAWVWNGIALAYQQLGRWPEAEQALQQGFTALTAAADANKAKAQATRAKLLNSQGRWYWYRNQPEQALQSWEQASLAYQQAQDRTGLTVSLINQAQALQTLGFSSRAEVQLRQVEALLQQESDPALQAVGLRDLGNALRRVGQLQESRQVLQASLEANSSGTQAAASYLDLGNTEQALGHKALAIGDRASAQIQFQQALAFYQQAESTAAPTALQAQLNRLSLLIDLGRSADALPLITTLRPVLDALPPSRSSLYARLNFAQSLAHLAQPDSAQPMPISSNLADSDPDNFDLTSFLIQTRQQAEKLGDLRALSYAQGQLGQFYKQTGQWQAAADLTQQAILAAEAIQAPDVRYRWEWQLGQIQQQQGDRAGALAAYQAAVASLQSVRNDLLAVSNEVQFSFRDDVEPVYRGLVELLLTADGASSSAGSTVPQANLKQAIQQINALQLAELNNFLGCNLAQTVNLGDVATDPTAVKLYPLLLPNQLAVVLERPGNQPLLLHQVTKPRAELLALLQELRRDLSAPDRTPEAIAGLSQLYDWLIAPFQGQLGPQTKTLVFVLDAELRNIPMAALYDATRAEYLVSRYAVAVAPRLELFQPSPRPPRLNLFLGGIGEPQTLQDRSFPPIEYLTPELDQIQTLVGAKPPLLNAAFTEANLEQQLQQGDFSVVHLKTHGIFSSDPEASFIVAYRELITGRDLGRLIQLGRSDRRLGEGDLELLVLSACSTAQGDNRAVLGLAGVAVQAGARSVVSTLWEAQDLPNTQLMVRFYQALLDPQISRAEALRQAQLHLLAQGYTTPHIWATYVLVGNWL